MARIVMIGKPSILKLFRVAFVGLFSFVLAASTSLSQVHVRGSVRRNGTYVQPHMRSVPDGIPYNNWSFPGNVNPYTGKVATGDPTTYLFNYYTHGQTPLISPPIPAPQINSSTTVTVPTVTIPPDNTWNDYTATPSSLTPTIHVPQIKRWTTVTIPAVTIPPVDIPAIKVGNTYYPAQHYPAQYYPAQTYRVPEYE
jgi:hypothetical protein